MTAAYGAAGTGALTATSGAACTPALPAGVVAGNLLVCHAFFGGSTTAPDTPSGWTLADGPRDLDTPGTNGRVWTFTKKAVGGDAAPALGTQAVTTPRRGRCYRFDGVLDDTVANMVGGFAYGTGTTTPLADAGVTTGADSTNYLAVQLIAGSDDTLAPGAMTGETGGDWTIPGGFTAFTSTTGTPDTWMGIQTSTVVPSTTINGGTAATTAGDPWGVVGFYIRSAPPKDTAPSITDTAETAWTGTGTSKSTTTTVSYVAGDTVYVLGATAQASSTTLGTPTHDGSNLPAFAAIGTAVGSGAQCWVHKWKAVATGTGSATVTESATSSSDPWGVIAYTVHGSDGTGNEASAVSAAKTVSLTRSDAHSFVLEIIADYAAGSATLTWTPSGQTEREATQDAGLYTVGVADWGDQGSAGATSYGVSAGFDATGPLTKLALEILGTIGGGQTVSMAQVTETETSQAVTIKKTQVAAQVTETETAQAVRLQRNIAGGQTTETETSQPVATRKTVVLGQVTETETAQAVTIQQGGGQTIPIAQVIETETAQAVTLRRNVTAGQITETETAQPVTLRKTETAGQVVETESAQPITLRKTETAAQVVETETSRPVTLRKTVVLGQVTEIETAQHITIAGPQTIPIAQVTETETAQAATLRRSKPIGQVTETETAQPVTVRRVVVLNQAVELELAQIMAIIGGAPIFTVGVATATIALTASGTATVTSASGKAGLAPAASGAHGESGG